MHGEVDPEHGQRLEIAGVAKRANVDGLETGGGDERLDGALSGGVVTAEETIGELAVEVRVAGQRGAEGVEGVDDGNAGMEGLKSRSAPPP